ncbi:RagB/SusD family nutrient uptake outer membrane protein [Terrimonas sp.]|uniref:RagB/SusD family nutrient uptake outer membrane protein n=1 Tax=Terrimonas sp. TaxID=1914338 RepID=UPI000D507DD1|nr:RagB/SusD family nutrient uptake outer membrane protein [Terrimonas sp.]PVD50789.1 RagB/SusD family nutrient uptake outer membrane protein [Terrimonas sp.]
MKSQIAIIIFSAAIFAGCKKFLDLKPETALTSETFFKNESDFKQAVNAAYVPLRPIFNDRSWVLGEMHSDNTYYPRNILFGAVDATENVADFAMPNSASSVSGITLTTNGHVLNQYRLDYQIIARTNQILAAIDGVDFDAASKSNLKGQALFLRAFAYFELVRYFGTAPLHLTVVGNRLEAAAELASKEQLYAQVEADAKEAANLLMPKSSQEPGRVTSGSAKMLLGDLYLWQKKYPEAETVLKEIVTSGEYNLMPTYDKAFSNTSDNKNNAESVFEVQYMEGAAGYNGSLIYNFLPRPMTKGELQPITQTSNPQDLSGEGNNIPTPDIIAAYEANDQRKDASIAYVTLSQSLRDNKVYPYIKKFAKPHSVHGNTGNNWPVYRYAEVLLALAEAINEQNRPGDADDYLNLVRNRAGLANTSASSQADMREAIFKERRVELAFENKRWFDIVRTNRIQEIIVPYGARIKANPKDYYFPDGAVPPNNAFTILDPYYGLPADESALSPYF